MEQQLETVLAQQKVLLEQPAGGPTDVNFYCNGVSFSNMIGNKRCNKIYFEEKYPDLRFHFKVDDSLSDMEYIFR